MDFSKEMNELFLMQQISASLFSVTNKIQMQGDKYLSPLTSRQIMLMVCIMHLPEREATQKNIAKMLDTSKQNVNTMVSALVTKGYLKTTNSSYDKREVNVTITDPGKQVMLECTEKSLAFFAEVFKDFSEEELFTLWKLLKKMYCFDGISQEKFEEKAMLEYEGNTAEWQSNAVVKFVELRRKTKVKKQAEK